jgi:hypothetical protein
MSPFAVTPETFRLTDGQGLLRPCPECAWRCRHLDTETRLYPWRRVMVIARPIRDRLYRVVMPRWQTTGRR